MEPWWNPRGTLPQGRPGPPRSLSGLRTHSFQLLGKTGTLILTSVLEDLEGIPKGPPAFSGVRYVDTHLLNVFLFLLSALRGTYHWNDSQVEQSERRLALKAGIPRSVTVTEDWISKASSAMTYN